MTDTSASDLHYMHSMMHVREYSVNDPLAAQQASGCASWLTDIIQRRDELYSMQPLSFEAASSRSYFMR